MGNRQTRVQLGLPYQTTSISLVNFHGIIFETEDFEKEVGELKTKGIETTKTDNTPYAKFTRLKDPDGNGSSFHQK